jgi:hypothetical protein
MSETKAEREAREAAESNATLTVSDEVAAAGVDRQDVSDEAIEAHRKRAEEWTPPQGHTTLLDEAIRDTAASPLIWDESLPADGIVEHNAPGEVIFSMVDETGKGDPLAQDPGAVLTITTEVPEQPAGTPLKSVLPKGSAAAEPKKSARKAPAKKAAGAKASK